VLAIRRTAAAHLVRLIQDALAADYLPPSRTGPQPTAAGQVVNLPRVHEASVAECWASEAAE
jgi:hypothetical protein